MKGALTKPEDPSDNCPTAHSMRELEDGEIEEKQEFT